MIISLLHLGEGPGDEGWLNATPFIFLFFHASVQRWTVA